MVLIDRQEYMTEEEKRLKEDRERTRYWKKWGPYVAERQWATGMFEASCTLRPHANERSSARGLFVSLHLHTLKLAQAYI